MQEINTIDLWTEVYANQFESFNGAFVDGFAGNNIPFDTYKIIKHCNCIISTNDIDIHENNKHNAIVFYKNNKPIRLVVANEDTNIEECVKVALNQLFNKKPLGELFKQYNITSTVVDMQQCPIRNEKNYEQQTDIGSCDRWALLYAMLKGSYTEDETNYGNFADCNYTFVPDLNLVFDLLTDEEHFIISHKCGFFNSIKTRLIPIQENSKLTKE